jgi:hypothetical protein
MAILFNKTLFVKLFSTKTLFPILFQPIHLETFPFMSPFSKGVTDLNNTYLSAVRLELQEGLLPKLSYSYQADII